jgi:Tfp pilus assembly protein PilE
MRDVLQPGLRAADSPGVTRLIARLRSEGGFGLVELMSAMVVLNIGLAALLAAFTNGILTAKRSGRVATASTLADTQIELYRALTYSAIALDPSSVPTSGPYISDSAYSASQVTGTCAGAVSSNPQCNASRTMTGPDHGTYEIDTYIGWFTPTNGRPAKQVTVVVRDTNNLSGPALVRRSTVFDESTGT